MPKLSQAEIVIDRLGSGTDRPGRYVDMRLDLVNEETGRLFVSGGGRWDRDEDSYVEGCQLRCVVKLQPAQFAAVRWLAKWIARHRERRAAPPPKPDFELLEAAAEEELEIDEAEVYSALFAGGRRAGKTHLGTLACLLYAVMFPDSRVWIVCPNEKDFEEVLDYLSELVPGPWIESELGAPWWRVELANGSRIVLRSAHEPDALKKGRCDFALINEGQRCKLRAFDTVRAAVSDKGGAVLIAANPPDTGDEQWVAEFAAEVLARRRLAVYLEFNPLLNPHINRTALLAIAREADPRTFEIQVLGRFLGRADAVVYNWIRSENELSPPILGDITRAYTKATEGRAYGQVVSCDIQRFPYICGTVWRFYGVLDHERVLAWCVDEIVLEGGDEDAIARELIDRGYEPEDTMIVCDSSGQWQHSRRRTTDQAPPEWRGKGSFDIFRAAGFKYVFPVDRRMRSNPDVVERCRSFCARVANYYGERRLFVDPRRCPVSCRAIRSWKTVHGKPHRTEDVAHIGDALTYFAWRFFPRRLKSGKPGQDGRRPERKSAGTQAARLLREASASVSAATTKSGARTPPTLSIAPPPPPRSTPPDPGPVRRRPSRGGGRGRFNGY